MGAACAPSYACLHLGWWEREVVYVLPVFEKYVALWVRYIDDVLVVLRGSSEQFGKFILNLIQNNRKYLPYIQGGPLPN